MEIVLSYYDCLIRKSDLMTLKSGSWINDTIISFWIEYLRNKHANSNYFLFDPSTVHLLKLCSVNDGCDILKTTELNLNIQWIILPMNSDMNSNEIGGIHWFLFIIHFDGSTIHGFYADSIHETEKNIEQSNKMLILFSSFLHAQSKSNIIIIPVPKQNNGSDCGVYCMKFIEEAIKTFNTKSCDESTSKIISNLSNFYFNPNEFRKFISSLIGSLKNV